MNSVKISIVGAGGTGQETAEALIVKGYSNLILIDVLEDMVAGKALDLWQSGAIVGRDVSVNSSKDISLVKDSDIVIITAGQGRRPGITREELLVVNGHLIANLASSIGRLCPNARLIVLTNPADLLSRIAWKASGLPSHQVVGQGGILDSARMKTFVAHELGVSVRDIQCMVLGGHGDDMVPVREFVRLGGAPVDQLLPEEVWGSIIERTRYGGGEILSKFRTHGASITPGWAVAEMVDALCSPTPRLLPVSTRTGGAYGLPEEAYVGLPTLISEKGVLRVLELALPAGVKQDLLASADRLQGWWKSWQKHTENSAENNTANRKKNN